MKQTLGALALLLASATTAQSAAVFAFNEDGSDLVGVLSGTLDLTGATINQGALSAPVVPFLDAREAVVVGGPGDRAVFISYDLAGPSSFGSGNIATGTYVGDLFALDSLFGVLQLSDTFTGGSLSGTLRVPDVSLADLGLTGTEFTFSLTNAETVTVTFGVTQIPVPAALPLYLVGLGAIGALARRRVLGTA
ncbi:MAG: VPLPA-CTERM sorting domain-containing protein [Pseudomonadota bacterium]